MPSPALVAVEKLVGPLVTDALAVNYVLPAGPKEPFRTLQGISTMMAGVQFEEIWKAFYTGYSKESLEQMLRFRLDKRLEDIVADGSLRSMVFNSGRSPGMMPENGRPTKPHNLIHLRVDGNRRIV
jgi:hypothetical protein